MEKGTQMFTGIVEELGTAVELKTSGDSAQLTISGPKVVSDAKHGDSIAVNGVCLTVIATGMDEFTVDVMRETLDRSALGELKAGDRVNLERAVRASERLGGHIVQGHVDGVGTVERRTPGDRLGGTAGEIDTDVVRIALPADLARYVAEKGSIAVDGVSLTVSAVDDARDGAAFEVSLIPTTLELTTLGSRQTGDLVNLEVDVIAKYVERLMRLGAR